METRNATPVFYFRKSGTASRISSADRNHAEGMGPAGNAYHRRVVEMAKGKHLPNPDGLRSRISDAFASTPSRNESAARAYRQTLHRKANSSVAQESASALIGTAQHYHQQLPRVLEEAKQRQGNYLNKIRARIFASHESQDSQAAKIQRAPHKAVLPWATPFKPSAQVFEAQRNAWQTNACIDFPRDPREAEIAANRKAIERIFKQSAVRERSERPVSQEDVDAFVSKGWGRPAARHAMTHKRSGSCLSRTIIADREDKAVKIRLLDVPPRARTPAPSLEKKTGRPLDMIRKEPPRKAGKTELIVDVLDELNDAREVFEATVGSVGVELPVKFSLFFGF